MLGTIFSGPQRVPDVKLTVSPVNFLQCSFDHKVTLQGEIEYLNKGGNFREMFFQPPRTWYQDV